MAPEKGYVHGEAFASGDLQVSSLHRIHYTQYGKPDGKSVIFLHGGPGGAGSSPIHTAFFDPAVFHVVLVDQRGAGLSEPIGEIRENTTQLLVEDIEKLRKHVGVQKWHMVFGGSWGSTLALAYSQAHPEACGSLVLRGVFLCSKEEFDFMLLGKATGMVWPEEYDRMIEYLPEEKRADPLQAYHDLIMSNDHAVAIGAAREWGRYALSTCALLQMPKEDIEGILGDERALMSDGKMTTHYFVNNAFLEKDQLLDGCEKIKHIPTRIVHGRYDLMCPPRVAWEIHKRLPNSQLYWSPKAGHAGMEPDTFKKLLEYCDELGQERF